VKRRRGATGVGNELAIIAGCIQPGADLLLSGRATPFQPSAREIVMAKGQMRSNKEKKKPKQDKNKKDKGAAASPFNAGQGQPGQNPYGKKGP
jgi:hypothetical protein